MGSTPTVKGDIAIVDATCDKLDQYDFHDPGGRGGCGGVSYRHVMHAALDALRKAGYVVIPRAAVEAMQSAGHALDGLLTLHMHRGETFTRNDPEANSAVGAWRAAVRGTTHSSGGDS